MFLFIVGVTSVVPNMAAHIRKFHKPDSWTNEKFNSFTAIWKITKAKSVHQNETVHTFCSKYLNPPQKYHHYGGPNVSKIDLWNWCPFGKYFHFLSSLLWMHHLPRPVPASWCITSPTPFIARTPHKQTFQKNFSTKIDVDYVVILSIIHLSNFQTFFFSVKVECTPSDMLVTLSFGQVSEFSFGP